MSTSQKPIRIILVDNQAASLGNIQAALELSAILQLVGQAANSQEAVQLCQMTQPDIALINLNAPGLDGLGVIHWLTRQQPQVTLLALCDPAGEDQLRAASKGRRLGLPAT